MGTFGKDTPIDRPSPGGRAAVFVPAEGANEDVAALFRNGSGIVGYGNHDGTISVYFENNRFNEGALFKWEDKAFKAYDRMVKLSPTTNRVSGDADNFVQVGLIEGLEIMVTDMERLRRWLEKTNTLETMPENGNIYAGGR
jgi:hypothetical protein